MRTLKFSIGDIITRGKPHHDMFKDNWRKFYLIHDIIYEEEQKEYRYCLYSFQTGSWSGYFPAGELVEPFLFKVA